MSLEYVLKTAIERAGEANGWLISPEAALLQELRPAVRLLLDRQAQAIAAEIEAGELGDRDRVSARDVRNWMNR